MNVRSVANFEEACARAIEAACNSPCQKSRRGVAMWHPGTAALWSACNAPAMGRCDGSDACRTSCPRICLHAEQTVILQAGRVNGRGAQGAELLHVKVKPRPEGSLLGTLVLGKLGLGVERFELVHSGPPSCVECSKLILAAGVAGVWLFHEEGWRRYEGHDFHRRTIQTLGLHLA